MYIWEREGHDVVHSLRLFKMLCEVQKLRFPFEIKNSIMLFTVWSVN